MYVPGSRHVMVGFDGSPNARTALRRGAAEARRRHARLDVVQVVPGDARQWLRTAADWLRLRTTVAQMLPRGQHVTTRLRVVHGRPGEVLPRLAEKAELLAIGARADSQHPFGGETVPAVLGAARCDVMICTAQQRSRAALVAD